MREVPLTNGMMAFVDDADYEFVSKFIWHASRGGGTNSGSNKYYAVRNIPHPSGEKRPCGRTKRKILKMHSDIMPCPENLQIDHIDGNTLNNQRSNLRLVTSQENNFNRSLSSNNTSGYKGVRRKRNKWGAYIKINRREIALGVFVHIKEAAKAYNIAALEHFGEFAKLNVISD